MVLVIETGEIEDPPSQQRFDAAGEDELEQQKIKTRRRR